MRYAKIRSGRFIRRPNRFIALVELDGCEQVCHVKNTGRCKELLLPGARVLVQQAENPARKTAFDLIAVYKGSRLVNIDSQAPNRVAAEYLPRLLPGLSLLRPEVFYGDSRLDFYYERPGQRGFVEVKGVTLERAGGALFPDAPTVRGIRHLQTLRAAVEEGFAAHVLFVVQLQGAEYFSPNPEEPAFSAALRAAAQNGVSVHAVDCEVRPDGVRAGQPMEIRL